MKKKKAPKKKAPVKKLKIPFPPSRIVPKLMDREDAIEVEDMESLEVLAEQEDKEEIDDEFETPEDSRF